jgi:hypothetical protein
MPTRQEQKVAYFKLDSQCQEQKVASWHVLSVTDVTLSPDGTT